MMRKLLSIFYLIKDMKDVMKYIMLLFVSDHTSSSTCPSLAFKSTILIPVRKKRKSFHSPLNCWSTREGLYLGKLVNEKALAIHKILCSVLSICL